MGCAKLFIKRLLLVAVIVCLPLRAADFWQSKPHTEWSGEELLKIITNSPWAKSVDVPLASMAVIVRAPGHIPLGPGRRGRIRPGGTAVRYPRTATVHLRWITALPVFEAVARSRFGDATGRRPANFNRIRRESFHILEVSGVPKALLSGQLQELRLRTSLRIKGLEPINPQSVRGEPLGAAGSIRFAFPKDEANGHTINLDDKEVEFQLKLDRTTIKKKFKLQKMIYQNKLEI